MPTPKSTWKLIRKEKRGRARPNKKDIDLCWSRDVVGHAFCFMVLYKVLVRKGQTKIMVPKKRRKFYLFIIRNR